MLLLGVLWWAWSAYAWLTNVLDPEEGAVRLAMLAAVAAMLVVSLAAPGAFGADGVIFGVAYWSCACSTSCCSRKPAAATANCCARSLRIAAGRRRRPRSC